MRASATTPEEQQHQSCRECREAASREAVIIDPVDEQLSRDLDALQALSFDGPLELQLQLTLDQRGRGQLALAYDALQRPDPQDPGCHALGLLSPWPLLR